MPFSLREVTMIGKIPLITVPKTRIIVDEMLGKEVVEEKGGKPREGSSFNYWSVSEFLGYKY